MPSWIATPGILPSSACSSSRSSTVYLSLDGEIYSGIGVGWASLEHSLCFSQPMLSQHMLNRGRSRVVKTNECHHKLLGTDTLNSRLMLVEWWKVSPWRITRSV